MSEFKFACPICSQHITADSSATGSQLDCPTCFRKIVVPQAPSAADPKFVLSATEVTKPRPTPATPNPQPTVTNRSIPMLMATVLVLACTAGASLFWFRGIIFKTGASPQPNAKDVSAIGTIATETELPASTNQLPWMLDLSEATVPEEALSGRIHERDFLCQRAVLQGGMLSFRMNPNKPLELGINIYLFARQAEELSGKSAIVSTNNIRAPRVALRWKEGGKTVSEMFTNGYALKLEFGNQNGNRMPGKLYLCLPDGAQSCIAGTFDAEVKKPALPKPKPAKTNQASQAH